MTALRTGHILFGEVSETGRKIFKAAALLIDSMPSTGRSALVEISAFLHYSLSPGKRRSVRSNLDVIGGGSGRVFPVFRNHALNMIEMFSSSRWDEAEIASRIEFDGRDTLDEALAEGRGAILVTAHIGNWELPALYLSSLGYRLDVVAGVQMNRLLSTAVRQEKERRGINVVEPASPFRALFRALAQGGIIALLMDGDVYRGGMETEFFGRRTSLPAGAAKLACRTGAPVLGAFCRRLGDKLSRVHMEKLLGPSEAEGMSHENAQAVVFGALERFIRDNVDQWCIFRKLWKDAA